MLSACLAVRDVQATLTSTIADLIDVLSELTGTPEVVIGDGGSTDATAEAAHELTRLYPQVRVVEKRSCQSPEAALKETLAHARGDFLLFADGGMRPPIGVLYPLWQRAATCDGVFAPLPIELFEQSAMLTLGGERAWAEISRIAPYCQIVRRDVMHCLQWQPLRGIELMAMLGRKGYHWAEIQYEIETPAPEMARGRHALRGSHAAKIGSRQAADRGEGGPQSLRRPNYLTRLKRFALGE